MSTADASPNKPFPPMPTTFIGAGFEWLKGQPFNNVVTTFLLVAMCAIAYGFWLAIPLHLRAIQDGYDRNGAMFERVASQQLATFKEDRVADRMHQKQMMDLIIKNKVGSSESRE